LSHGERKRAQIAVALHQRPGFLTVDEPTNHLDYDTAKQVWQALKLFQGVGLLVSHDRRFLGKLAERIWTIRKGGEYVWELNPMEYPG